MLLEDRGLERVGHVLGEGLLIRVFVVKTDLLVHLLLGPRRHVRILGAAAQAGWCSPPRAASSNETRGAPALVRPLPATPASRP